MNITEPSIMAIRIAAADPGETLVYKGDKPLQAIRARGLRDVTIIGDTHPIRFVGEQTTFRDCHNLRIVNASFRYFGPGETLSDMASFMQSDMLRNGRALVLHDCHKVTLENCDMGWATDDTVSIHGQCSDITLQSCLIHGGQGPNTKGLLAASELGGQVDFTSYVTMRDCVFEGVTYRTPKVFGNHEMERCIVVGQTDPCEPGGNMTLRRVTFAPRPTMIARPIAIPMYGGTISHGGVRIIGQSTGLVGLAGRGDRDLQNPTGPQIILPGVSPLTDREHAAIIAHVGPTEPDDAIMFARQRARAALGIGG